MGINVGVPGKQQASAKTPIGSNPDLFVRQRLGRQFCNGKYGSITSIGNQVTHMQQLDARQPLYHAQFNALSKVVASVTNPSNYLRRSW